VALCFLVGIAMMAQVAAGAGNGAGLRLLRQQLPATPCK